MSGYNLRSAAWCRRFNFEALMLHIREMTPDRLGDFIKSRPVNDPFIPLLTGIKGIVDFVAAGGSGDATEGETESGEPYYFVRDCLELILGPRREDQGVAFDYSRAQLFDNGISFDQWECMSTFERIEALGGGRDFRNARGHHCSHMHLGRLVAGLAEWTCGTSSRNDNFTLSIPEPALQEPEAPTAEELSAFERVMNTPLIELSKQFLLGNEGASSAAE